MGCHKEKNDYLLFSPRREKDGASRKKNRIGVKMKGPLSRGEGEDSRKEGESHFCLARGKKSHCAGKRAKEGEEKGSRGPR